MADKKISQLTAATTPLAGTEVLPIVQGGSTVKVPVSDLTAGRTVSAAQVNVDNIRIDGNDIYSTDTNGNVNIYTNGSGVVNVPSPMVVSGNNDNITIKYVADGGQALLTWKSSNGTTLWDIGGGNTVKQDELSFRHSGTVPVLYLADTFDVHVKQGNLVIGTSGKGIDFSATAGTGTSELLADYEEGTWTPAILTYGGGATDPTFTGLVVSGRYTKIGRQVTATGRMYWTGITGGSGLVAIQGLPYTIASEDGFMGVMKYNTTYQAGTGVANTIYAQNLMPRFWAAGYDRIKFGYAASGNITGDLAVSDLINSTQYFEFSVTYFN